MKSLAGTRNHHDRQTPLAESPSPQSASRSASAATDIIPAPCCLSIPLRARVGAHTSRSLVASLAGVQLRIGLLMVYSASMTARPTEFEQVYLSRQLQFAAVAILLGVGGGALPARVWHHLAPWALAATALGLLLVVVPGVGHEVNGAQR